MHCSTAREDLDGVERLRKVLGGLVELKELGDDSFERGLGTGVPGELQQSFGDDVPLELKPASSLAANIPLLNPLLATAFTERISNAATITRARPPCTIPVALSDCVESSTNRELGERWRVSVIQAKVARNLAHRERNSRQDQKRGGA